MFFLSEIVKIEEPNFKVRRVQKQKFSRNVKNDSFRRAWLLKGWVFQIHHNSMFCGEKSRLWKKIDHYSALWNVSLCTYVTLKSKFMPWFMQLPHFGKEMWSKRILALIRKYCGIHNNYIEFWFTWRILAEKLSLVEDGIIDAWTAFGKSYNATVDEGTILATTSQEYLKIRFFAPTI